MKKETVNILKPRKSIKTGSKVKKVFKKKGVKISEKIIEKSCPTNEQRATKLIILNIENVNIKNNGILLKKSKPESVETKTANILDDENCKTKKQKNEVKKKMALLIRNDENETRGGSKKKRRNEAVEKVNESTIKKKKSLKAKIDSSKKTTDVKSDIRKNSKSNTTKGSVNMNKSGHLKLTKQHILSSAKAIKKLCKNKLNSKNSLLPTENHPIYLQVVCVKIPKTPRRFIRTFLPHPLMTHLDEIAIFVPDLELGRKKDYEKTVEHWETRFREKGIDFIKQVIPMNQVKTEYNQFEMLRKLSTSFDYFLADGRIVGHLTHLLGKCFFKRRSPPTPVKLSRDNLKEDLNFALRKTCMEIHSNGNSHMVQAGTLSMKSTHLTENVWAICETLCKQYPGGWSNIRSIYMKSQSGPSIPIYLNLSSKNNVRTPIVKPKRPRAYETVEGELTTVYGHATVTVTPEGKVKLKRKKDFKENDEIKEEDEEKMKAEENNDNDDDDDDDE